MCRTSFSITTNAASKLELHLQVAPTPQSEKHGRKLTVRDTLKTLILLGCILSVAVAATAQEVVHALTGTVRSIDPASKTITIFTDNGSEGLFKNLTNPKLKIDFDKKLRTDASTVDTFKGEGTYVIVYYFGDGNVRTAVALRNLGSGPFTNNIGTVVKLEGRGRLLLIKDKSGSVESFKITPDTVAETDVGVVDGFKFQPQKDDQVRVVATMVNGTPTALFIRTM
jgi:Cu/Ag efflux protein CusF